MIPEIPVDAQIKTDSVVLTDKQSLEQKQQQVKTQAESLQQQAQAREADLAQDAKAASDKAKKELGQVPQKIEDTEDEIIDKLKGFLNASPGIKPKKVKTPDGFEYEVPDFNPDQVISKIRVLVDPMLVASTPIQAYAGSIPVLGDLVSMLTTISSDKSGESDISEEELYKLVPTPPDIPPAIVEKADKIIKLIGQAIQYLPIFLIDAIAQMLQAIYGMFQQISQVIGVPTIPAPFSLIGSLVTLVPKVKDLVTKAPSEIEEVIKQKMKKKFHYAAALSVPKPNLKAVEVETGTGNMGSSKADSAQVEGSSTSSHEKIQQSQQPPVASNIPETPSVPPVEPKPPIKEQEPTSRTFSIFIIGGSGVSNPTKTRISVANKSNKETITTRIDNILTKYPNIQNLGGNYQYSSDTKSMTWRQACAYFGSVFGGFWKSRQTIKCNGQEVSLTRNYDVTVGDMKSSPVKVLVQYEQYGYANLENEDGDIYESDDEFVFPDGFLTI